jgi:hypothetical protein
MMSKTAVVPHPLSTAPSREGLALLLLVVATVTSALGVPGAAWRASSLDPCHLGVVGGLASTATLIVTRFFGDRALAVERLTAAVFLFAMPLIYVSIFLVSSAPGGSAPWLFIELAAVPFYGALAIAGYRGRFALLAIGIAAHGLGWDAWHYTRSAYVPDWYSLACLELDLAMALYVAARIPRWRAAAAPTMTAAVAA